MLSTLRSFTYKMECKNTIQVVWHQTCYCLITFQEFAILENGTIGVLGQSRIFQEPYDYTCQLFLRYKLEIFILGVLGFLKKTRSFPKIPEEVRSLPKTSEVCWSLPKASSLPVLFTSKIRDREEGIAIYSFYTWFSFLTWVWVNVFLEIVSSRTATTHIFQSGVRNWPAGVSRREIEVFNPQAWDSRLRRESWQVYMTPAMAYNLTRNSTWCSPVGFICQQMNKTNLY